MINEKTAGHRETAWKEQEEIENKEETAHNSGFGTMEPCIDLVRCRRNLQNVRRTSAVGDRFVSAAEHGDGTEDII